MSTPPPISPPIRMFPANPAAPLPEIFVVTATLTVS
jgi:hypothetical protein